MKFKGIRDIRDYQILFLSLFLVLGIVTRDWTLRPEWIALIIATCLSTQWLLSQLLLVDRWWLVGKIDNQQPTKYTQSLNYCFGA
jgi:Na+-transporting NADH:ubiquinone oxidoreductase subunit NqrB